MNQENLKEIYHLRIQVALLVHERSPKTEVSQPKEVYTKESQTDSKNDKEVTSEYLPKVRPSNFSCKRRKF